MSTNPPGYIREYFEREKAKIVESLGGVCSVCKTDRNLHIHHCERWKGRKGTNGRGRLSRLTDWKRELPKGTLELRCEEHHLKMKGVH